MGHFVSYGGGVHETAIVGHPPESREWQPGMAVCVPEIAATARLEAYVTVDAGMRRPTYVGARAWLMKKVHIGHDAIVMEDCEMAPGGVLCGHAILCSRVKCGVGALILPFRTVGRGAIIGAGAVVTKNVPAGETWVGNPARRLPDSGRDPRPHTER